MVHAGIGDIQVEDGGGGVENRYKEDACFRYRIYAGVYEGEIKPEK